MKKLNGIVLNMMLVSSLLSSQSFASPLKMNSGTVSFMATGKPGFLKINGNGAEVTGELDKNPAGITGVVTVLMERFSTGIAMRDEHMKEKYLEVKKFPVATLKITELLLTEGKASQEQVFKGTLNFHGVEKVIEGLAQVDVADGKIKIDAKFSLVISDYKIEIPSFSGVKVADKVDVTAEIAASL